MEASSIEFCNTIGFILRNNKDKSNILSNIQDKFNINILNQDYLTFSENTNHTYMINKFPYIGSLITRGNKFLMYFTRIYGENTVFMIDRKVKREENIIFPKIISICLQAENELFDDTLLEVETILEKNEWTIVFSDIIAKNGNYCKYMHIFDRINSLFDINSKIYLDSYLNPFKIKIKEFYDICCLKNLEIENGIYFHPLNGKHKTIEYRIKGYKESKQLLYLINYDIKNGLEIQLNEIKENNILETINLTEDIKKNIDNKEIVGQVEITKRYGLYKVSLLKEKDLVEIGFVRFSSLENKDEFSKLIEKYKTIRLILNYNSEYKKWVPKQIADKKPFTNLNEIKDILDYERTFITQDN